MKLVRIRTLNRTSLKEVSHGKMQSWGLTFQQLGGKPDGLSLTMPGTGPSETYEVIFTDKDEVQRVYDAAAEFLVRANMIKGTT